VVEKGSIAVDGISLTVTEVGGGRFGVAIIPHTLAQTTLRAARRGRRVNIETDILAKYVWRLLGGSSPDGVTTDLLAKHGFI
jgi:riboflavin synthase